MEQLLSSFEPWPFETSPDAACVTLRSVVEGSKPVLMVSRDTADGTWQMLTGDAFEADETRHVSLGAMVERDARLRELADLPTGWMAWREHPQAPWARLAEAEQTAD